MYRLRGGWWGFGRVFGAGVSGLVEEVKGVLGGVEAAVLDCKGQWVRLFLRTQLRALGRGREGAVFAVISVVSCEFEASYNHFRGEGLVSPEKSRPQEICLCARNSALLT